MLQWARVVKFSCIMIGINMIKAAESDDRVSQCIGTLLVFCPVIYELVPQAKALFHKLTGFTSELKILYEEDKKKDAKEKAQQATRATAQVPRANPRAAEILRDESLERKTVTFSAGPMGCAFSDDGVVTQVLAGSQAAEQAVEVGWHCLEVGGEKPASSDEMYDLLKRHRDGLEEYSVIFLVDGEVVRANTTFIASLTAKHEEEKPDGVVNRALKLMLKKAALGR